TGEVNFDGLTEITTLFGGELSETDKVMEQLRWRLPPARKLRFAHVLKAQNAQVEIAKLPPEQQADRFQELEPARQEESLVHALTIGNSKAARAFQRSQARLRTAVAALAAERFRQERGQWPSSLGELVPAYLAAVPTDPYD